MPHRFICDVLDEMLVCDKTKHYSSLPGLVGEARTMARRMEEALSEQSDIDSLRRRVKNAKKELAKLNKEIEDSGGERVLSCWEVDGV